MKKLAAILLLLLFLFNLAGYRVWFYYVQQKVDTQLQLALDNDEYDENQLITIRIPLSLPYQTNWSDFERVDGEVNLDGTIYKYVKRKVSNGELILLCLPDHQKMHLQTAKDTFFKFANDLQTETSKKTGNTGVFKNSLSDYYFQYNDWQVRAFVLPKQYDLPESKYIILSGIHNSPEQPPDTPAAWMI